MEKNNFLKDISSDIAINLIEKHQNDNNFVIIDVRTPREFNMGKIGNAINIDIFNSQFAEKINKLDKEKIYLVYCQTGNRSSMAINIMQKTGFTKIYHLARGYLSY